MTNTTTPDFYDIDALLTDDERQVRDTVGRFVDEQVIPVIADCFEHERFPNELVTAMGELGLLGPTLPDYGCAGLSDVAYGLIMQELERGDSGIRSFASVQSSLVMYPIFTWGSDEQKQRWLPPMARGKAIGCFGLTEPDGGSDPGVMKTRAVRDGDDWVLNGSKMWITSGSVADVAIVQVLHTVRLELPLANHLHLSSLKVCRPGSVSNSPFRLMALSISFGGTFRSLIKPCETIAATRP